MMKILYKLPFLLLLLIPSLLCAQKTWSLEECIKYAWDNNLRIKQQEIIVEQSSNNILQSKLSYLPTVSASINHSMNWGRSVNMQDLQIVENKLSQNTGASMRASINLFEGFQKPNEILSKQLIHEITLQDVSRLKNDISIEISRAYLQIMLSRDILATAKQSYKSVVEQAARTKFLVDAGSQAMGSLLELQAQIASERVQVVNAENQVKNNILTLKQLLDLSGNSDFDIASPNIDLITTKFNGESVDQLFQLSKGLPQIKSAELGFKNSEVQLALAKGRIYPTISFSAGYGTNYSDGQSAAFFTQFNQNRNPSIGFSMSIPIFNSYTTRTAIKNARLSVKSSQIDVRSKEQVLYKEIQQANNEAIALFEKLNATSQNVTAMEESFRYVQQKFDIGNLNATDYTVAKTNLFKAKSDYYQAKYQYVFQLKILDFYKGTPITL